VSLLIQKSATKKFFAADSKIGSKTTALLIQKLAANCALADSEIGSQKNALLLIQKSTAKLGRCQFRNQQPTVPLLI